MQKIDPLQNHKEKINEEISTYLQNMKGIIDNLNIQKVEFHNQYEFRNLYQQILEKLKTI